MRLADPGQDQMWRAFWLGWPCPSTPTRRECKADKGRDERSVLSQKMAHEERLFIGPLTWRSQLRRGTCTTSGWACDQQGPSINTPTQRHGTVSLNKSTPPLFS